MTIMPPGKKLAWYPVVEMELDEVRARTRGLTKTVVVICIMQILFPIVVPIPGGGEREIWEAWAMPGQEERLGKGIAQAVERLLARQATRT